MGDTTDSQRGKFYGDVSARLTEISTLLLFFELELNRIDDAALEQAMKVPALAHYRPWIDNLRMEKPYQLDDKLEELFLEKSQTSSAAFNRLFDETMAGLRFEVDGEKLSLEPTLNLMQTPDEAKRKAGCRGAGQDLRRERQAVHADHQHARQGQGDLRPLARLQGHRRRAPPVQPRRARGGRCAGRIGAAAYPKLSHRYYRMKAKWLGKDKLMHWDRNAPLPAEDTREVPWAEAQDMVLSAYGQFAPEMADDRQDLLRQALDRCAVAPRQGAGRLRASDRALGAPLRAAELPRQDAGRDDAGA